MHIIKITIILFALLFIFIVGANDPCLIVQLIHDDQRIGVDEFFEVNKI